MPHDEHPVDNGPYRLGCTPAQAFSFDELLAIYRGVLERGENYPWSTTAQILTQYVDLAQRLARLARQRGDSRAAEALLEHAREGETRLWHLRQGRLDPGLLAG